jgi:hypothetical protein
MTSSRRARTSRATILGDASQPSLYSLASFVNTSRSNRLSAFLRDGFSGKRLLDGLLADLHTKDGTLRCAAARLVCQLAYENLVNQEAIAQLTTKTNGFSLGWLHVFSVPPAYRTAYESQSNSPRSAASWHLSMD